MDHVTSESLRGTHNCELAAQEKRKPGPPPDPNAKQHKTISLRKRDWDYIMQWHSEKEPNNATRALENFLEESRRMAPAPGYSRKRDEKGRWLPDEKK